MATTLSSKHASFAVVLAIAMASAVSSPAAAEDAASSSDVARAETYAAQAFSAYSNKDYAEAVALYLKALDAAPSADILYNLARIYDTKLSDRELAMRFYRRYIADPGADPERVRSANERLLRLRELEIAAAEEPSATGTAEFPVERQQPAERPRRLSGLEIGGLVTGIVGLGGLALGAGFGLAAKSDADVAKELCDGNICRTQRGVDAAHQASDAATISTVSLIAGGALTLVGTAMFVVGRRRSSRGDVATTALVPAFGPGYLGTQLAGRW